MVRFDKRVWFLVPSVIAIITLYTALHTDGFNCGNDQNKYPLEQPASYNATDNISSNSSDSITIHEYQW